MIFHQSVFEKWPLEDGSVQAVITSPPYWGLRKYQIPDVQIGDWTGQYGLEPDFKMYIAHTLQWAREAWRVLRDDGIFFLNIGDSYGGSGGCHKEHHKNDSSFQSKMDTLRGGVGNTFLPKCLLLIPPRIAIGLIDEGWTLRNDIIWHKTNAMPESVTDRFSKKHENIFMFTKQTKYYFDLDAVKIPSITIDARPDAFERTRGRGYNTKLYGRPPRQHQGNYQEKPASLIKNPGDVWSIPPQPSPEKHYAMWPEKLVGRMILCSTKPGDTILDPFCGSGTTLKVAEELGRKGAGIDLGYGEIQERRLKGIQKEMI